MTFIENPTAVRIAADPSLIAFIPDEKFRAQLRATVAGSRLGSAATTAFITVRGGDDRVTVHTWHHDDTPVSGRAIGQHARRHVTGHNRTRTVTRLSHNVFSSPDAGTATETVYRINKGEYER